MAEAAPGLDALRGSLTKPLDILNLALGLLGEDEVNDFNPDPDWSSALLPETTAGKKVALFWYEAIDDVQQTFYWQELINTVTLTDGSAADAYGRYSHDLSVGPLDDMIRPMGVLAKSVNGTAVVYNVNPRLRNPQDSNIAYTISGDTLYSRADEIDLTFIKREVDPANWSGEMARTIYYNLAMLSARSVTTDPNVLSNLIERYEMLVKPLQVALQSSYKTNDINTTQDVGFIQAQRQMGRGAQDANR